MSLECSECEHDLRGGHAEDCSRYEKPEQEPRSPGNRKLPEKARQQMQEEG